MITCPMCGSETSVTETRRTEAGARRRRRCDNLKCDYRITTLEVVMTGTGDTPSPANHKPPIGDVVLVPQRQLKRLIAIVDAIRDSNRLPIPKSWKDTWTGGQET